MLWIKIRTFFHCFYDCSVVQFSHLYFDEINMKFAGNSGHRSRFSRRTPHSSLGRTVQQKDPMVTEGEKSQVKKHLLIQT